MPRYAAFLRGINLGGRRIKMEDLRAAFETICFPYSQTILASGIVVFESEENDPAKVAHKLEIGLQEAFNYEVTVILRTAEEIRELVEGNPFGEIKADKDTKFSVSFFAKGADHDLDLPYKSPEDDFSKLAITPSYLLSVVRLGPRTGTLNLMDFLAKCFGDAVSTRTWNPVLKVKAKLNEL